MAAVPICSQLYCKSEAGMWQPHLLRHYHRPGFVAHCTLSKTLQLNACLAFSCDTDLQASGKSLFVGAGGIQMLSCSHSRVMLLSL